MKIKLGLLFINSTITEWFSKSVLVFCYIIRPNIKLFWLSNFGYPGHSSAVLLKVVGPKLPKLFLILFIWKIRDETLLLFYSAPKTICESVHNTKYYKMWQIHLFNQAVFLEEHNISLHHWVRDLKNNSKCSMLLKHFFNNARTLFCFWQISQTFVICVEKELKHS